MDIISLQEENTRLRGVLKKYQYRHSVMKDVFYCISCRALQGQPCKPACEISAVLGCESSNLAVYVVLELSDDRGDVDSIWTQEDAAETRKEEMSKQYRVPWYAVEAHKLNHVKEE